MAELKHSDDVPDRSPTATHFFCLLSKECSGLAELALELGHRMLASAALAAHWRRQLRLVGGLAEAHQRWRQRAMKRDRLADAPAILTNFYMPWRSKCDADSPSNDSQSPNNADGDREGSSALSHGLARSIARRAIIRQCCIAKQDGKQEREMSGVDAASSGVSRQCSHIGKGVLDMHSIRGLSRGPGQERLEPKKQREESRERKV